MADKKYVKLKPWKMGFEFLGTLRLGRQSLLLDVLEGLKRDMGESWAVRLAAREIFWLNVWHDEADDEEVGDAARVSDPEVARVLDKWCRKAARKYAGRKAILDGYGYVVNPKGSSKYQPWHIDYTTDAAVIWIPITPLTPENATEYITLPPNTPDIVLEQVASYVDEVDVAELANAVDYYVINQTIAKPMSVLFMGRGTIHRGIPNAGSTDRIVFYISVHFIKNYKWNYPYHSDSYDGTESGVEVFGE